MLMQSFALIVMVSHCVQIGVGAYHSSDELAELVLNDYSDTFNPVYLHREQSSYEIPLTREDISSEGMSTNHQANANDNININANINQINQPDFFESSMRIPPPTSSEGESIELTLSKKTDLNVSQLSKARLTDENILKSRKSIGKSNECRNDPRKKQYYSKSFNAISANSGTSWSQDPTILRKHTMHYNVDITLCWIETTTIKQNLADPAKKFVLREYSITFENSAIIPDEHLKCSSIPGEVLADENKAVCNTSFTQVIIEDTKVSRVVNQTTQSYEEGFRATQTRLIKCAMGSVMSKDMMRWLNDPAARRRRLEMTVSPVTRTMDDFCSSLEVCDESGGQLGINKPFIPEKASESIKTQNDSCVGSKCGESYDLSSCKGSQACKKSDKNPLEIGQELGKIIKTEDKSKKLLQGENLGVETSGSGRRLRTFTTPTPRAPFYTNPMKYRNGNTARRGMVTDRTTSRHIYNQTVMRPMRHELKSKEGLRANNIRTTHHTTRRTMTTIGENDRNGWHTFSHRRELQESDKGPRGLTPSRFTATTYASVTIHNKFRNGYGWYNRRELVDSDHVIPFTKKKTRPAAGDIEIRGKVSPSPRENTHVSMKAWVVGNENLRKKITDSEKLNLTLSTGKSSITEPSNILTNERPMGQDMDSRRIIPNNDSYRRGLTAPTSTTTRRSFIIMLPHILQNGNRDSDNPKVLSSKDELERRAITAGLGFPHRTTKKFTRSSTFYNREAKRRSSSKNANECPGCLKDDDDDEFSECDCSAETSDEQDQDQDEILSLRVQVTLEHIGDDNKIQKLVGVDRNLTVDRQLNNDNQKQSLQWRLQELNQSANKLKTIRDLFNCSILEDIYNGINGVYYAQSERSRSRRAVNCTGIDVGNSNDEVIMQCLPGMRSDLQVGFHQVISNLTKNEPEMRMIADTANYKVRNGAIFTNRTLRNAVPLPGNRQRRSLKNKAIGEIGHWSKERFTRSLDGRQLHTVTRLSLHRDFNNK